MKPIWRSHQCLRLAAVTAFVGSQALTAGNPAFAQEADNATPASLHSSAPIRKQQVIEQTWTVQQGAPEDISAMAQTADGYLWLGGTGGLFRFDGTRFERFHSSSGDPLLSTNLHSLFAPTTGGLWVGYTFGGFSFVSNGRVKSFGGEIASSTGSVLTFAQDPNGDIWAGTNTGVWRLEGSTWRHLGGQWNAPAGSVRIAFDRVGTLWAIASATDFTIHNKLLYLPAGSRRFHVANEDMDYHGFTVDADGKGVTSSIVPQPAPNSVHIESNGLQAYPIFGPGYGQIVDRANGVWINTLSKLAKPSVLLRIQALSDLKDAATRANADNSETYHVTPYYGADVVDREGNIWFADANGVHRFFYTPFSKQEVPFKGYSAIASDDEGAIWIGSWASQISDELYRVTDDKLDRLAVPGSRDWSFAYRATDKTFWFGAVSGLWHLIDGKLFAVPLPREMVDSVQYLQTITEDRGGGLWVSFGRHGLYRLADGQWTSYGGRQDLPKTGVVIEFTDSLQRVWFGFTKNQIAVLDGEKVRVYAPGDGVQVGNVTAISGRGPNVWIGGEFGLQKFDNGRFRSILAADQDWLLGISGIVEAADGDLWLNGLTGIFHINRAEIAEALKDPSYRVRGEHIGAREGLPGFAAQLRPLPTAIEGSDGRLWFSESSGVVWLDPTRARQQSAVPPLTIQTVSADDRNYEASSSLTFPAHTSSVTIRYSAISLSDPEAVRSRVRLRETDANWHEVTTGEPITYRNLAPGHYHFSVGVSDTNGVWSNKVANLDFTIAPAWYQTNWFRTLCVGAFLLFLWLLYQFRLRQLQHQFNIGLEAQVIERTRIARELHDTMLQSFQGLLLRFQAVSNLLPARPEEAKTRIDSVIEEGSNAITEGRDAVHELRSAGLTAADLAQSIRNFSKELLGNMPSENLPEFRLQVEGTPKDLNPVVRDEVYRIAVEALRNAIRHAGAKRIEVEIRYDPEDLELRIRDDGKGIDTGVLDKEHAPGHWGLCGMRERAKLIGASFEIWSKFGSGTEIELTIPAASAYAKPIASRRPFASRSSRS